jgi:hypothetical protein
MALQLKGEIQIEKGLGLPLYTTAERLAYTPPREGYIVWDTDLNKGFIQNGSVWEESAGSAGKDTLFADNTTVAPATTGKPTLAEIATFAGTNVDIFIYYTGTDLLTDSTTRLYFLDQSGTVTLVNVFTGDTDSDTTTLLVSENAGEREYVNREALKTIVIAAPPVDGVQVAYEIGQLLWDNVNKKLYETTAKSTDPDVAPTGSTFSEVILGAAPNNRLFADATTVAPATIGHPTVAEITTFLGTNTDVFIYYTGDDLPASDPTRLFYADAAGTVTSFDTIYSADGSIGGAQRHLNIDLGGALTIGESVTFLRGTSILKDTHVETINAGANPGSVLTQLFLDSYESVLFYLNNSSPAITAMPNITFSTGNQTNRTIGFNNVGTGPKTISFDVAYKDFDGVTSQPNITLAAGEIRYVSFKMAYFLGLVKHYDSGEINVSKAISTGISPAANDATGAIGTDNNEYAAGDHKHIAQGISADAEQLITVGTDGLHLVDPDTLISTDANNILSKGVDLKLYANGITTVTTDTTSLGVVTTGNTTNITLLSADALNYLSIGSDGGLFLAIGDATDTVKGIVELATDAEMTTGTSTVLAITPANAKVELDKKSDKTIATTDSDSGLSLVSNNSGIRELVSQDAIKTIVLAAAPVDNTTVAYFVGQLLWDNVNKKLYEALTKSTDPDAAGTGSTFLQIPSSLTQRGILPAAIVKNGIYTAEGTNAATTLYAATGSQDRVMISSTSTHGGSVISVQTGESLNGVINKTYTTKQDGELLLFVDNEAGKWTVQTIGEGEVIQELLAVANVIDWDVKEGSQAFYTVADASVTFNLPTNLVKGKFYTLSIVNTFNNPTIAFNAGFKDSVGGLLSNIKPEAGQDYPYLFLATSTSELQAINYSGDFQLVVAGASYEPPFGNYTTVSVTTASGGSTFTVDQSVDNYKASKNKGDVLHLYITEGEGIDKSIVWNSEYLGLDGLQKTTDVLLTGKTKYYKLILGPSGGKMIVIDLDAPTAGLALKGVLPAAITETGLYTAEGTNSTTTLHAATNIQDRVMISSTTAGIGTVISVQAGNYLGGVLNGTYTTQSDGETLLFIDNEVGKWTVQVVGASSAVPLVTSTLTVPDTGSALQTLTSGTSGEDYATARVMTFGNTGEVVNDVTGVFDVVNDYIEFKKAGKYRVTARIDVEDAGGNSTSGFMFVGNQTNLVRTSILTLSASWWGTYSFDFIETYAIGDKLDFRATHVSGENHDLRNMDIVVTEVPTSEVVLAGMIVPTSTDFGAATTITDGQTNATTTYADVTNGSITLLNIGTYSVSYHLTGSSATAIQGAVARLVNGSNVEVVGSVIQSADTTALVEFAMSQKVQITTTSVNEVYKLQFKNTAVGIATLHNNSVDGNSNVLYQQIPDSTIINVDPTLVTPDLLSRTTVTGITSAAITGAGTPLIFTTVQGVAGIPYDPSTGFFSLTANNTYRLQATFKLTSGNPKMGWCEASSSVALIPGTDLASAGTALTTETVELVYTPTVNMDVKCAATTASALTINTFSGYAIAEQLSMSTITQVDPTLLTPVDLDYLSLTTDEAGNGNRGISTLVTTIGSGYRTIHLADTDFVGRTLDTNSIIDAGGYHVVIKKSGLYEMSVGYAQDNDDAEPAVFVNGVILVGAMTFATTWTHSTASGIKYLNIGDTVEFGHLNTTPRSVNGECRKFSV